MTTVQIWDTYTTVDEHACSRTVEVASPAAAPGDEDAMGAWWNEAVFPCSGCRCADRRRRRDDGPYTRAEVIASDRPDIIGQSCSW
jgi:hypothetical protein